MKQLICAVNDSANAGISGAISAGTAAVDVVAEPLTAPTGCSRTKRQAQTRISALRKAALGIALLSPLITCTFITCTPAIAADSDLALAASRTEAFLETPQHGSTVLGFLHYGADYKTHSFLGVYNVADSAGRTIPGQFALDYRFKWEDDGVTDVAFLCDARGSIYAVQVLHSNAGWSQPFAFANAAIQLVGNLVISSSQDRMSETERKLAQALVDHADAKGLLELWLRVQQAAQ